VEGSGAGVRAKTWVSGGESKKESSIGRVDAVSSRLPSLQGLSRKSAGVVVLSNVNVPNCPAQGRAGSPPELDELQPKHCSSRGCSRDWMDCDIKTARDPAQPKALIASLPGIPSTATYNQTPLRPAPRPDRQ